MLNTSSKKNTDTDIATNGAFNFTKNPVSFLNIVLFERSSCQNKVNKIDVAIIKGIEREHRRKVTR